MILIDVVHAAIGVTQLGGDVVRLVESLPPGLQIGFENPQRVSDGNEAHPQLLGDRQDHGTDALARTSTRSHRSSVAERRRYAIDPGPC